MKIKKQLEHKIAGGRNSSCRKIFIHGDKLYISFLYDKGGFYESLIQCLRKDDFTVLWEHSYRHVVFSLFVSQHDTLIASFMDGKVKCLDLESGADLWEFESGCNIALISNESDGKVIVSGLSEGKTTWCIDAANGNVLWKTPNRGHSYVPIIHGNKIYNTVDHTIFCTNFEDGSAIWENREPETYLTNIHVFRDFVIATGHGIFNFYDLSTGSICGSAQTGTRDAIGWMTSENDRIYFGDEGGFFHCYKVHQSGSEVELEPLWKINAGHGIKRAAVIEGDHLYVAVENFGFLYLSKDKGEIVLEKKIKGEGSFLVLEEDKIYFGAKMSLFQFEIQ